MNPIVSIITPAYNAEKFIAETIQSVIHQTFPDWEMIIVVDGATDRTLSIAETFTSDPRIKVHYKKNSGVADTRNHGIALSQGTYITFLDSDDCWFPNNLQDKIEALKNHPEADWVFSQMELMDENAGFIALSEKGRSDNILNNILMWEGEVIPAPCSNILLHRKCFEMGLKFDASLSTAADQDFTIQLANQSKGIMLDSVHLRYRVVSNSMSRNIPLMERDHIAVYKKAAKLKLFKSFCFKKRCFAQLYLILAGSWWHNGGSRKRGILFLFKSLFTHPLPLLRRLTR